MGQPTEPLQNTDGEYIQKQWIKVIQYLRVVLMHMPKLDRETLGVSLSKLMWSIAIKLEKASTYKNTLSKQEEIKKIIFNIKLIKCMLQIGKEASMSENASSSKLQIVITDKRYVQSIILIEPVEEFLKSWLNKLDLQIGMSSALKT